MSFCLPHLDSAWSVDQAIQTEEERVVILRFGEDDDDTCMLMDECLFTVAEKIKKFAVIYLVDYIEVKEFIHMVRFLHRV